MYPSIDTPIEIIEANRDIIERFMHYLNENRSDEIKSTGTEWKFYEGNRIIIIQGKGRGYPRRVDHRPCISRSNIELTDDLKEVVEYTMTAKTSYVCFLLNETTLDVIKRKMST